MFCSKCGAQNTDGVAFCTSCGNKLADAAASTAKPLQTLPTGKSPFVAAFLNLFFGIGYLYLGYNKVLGVPAIVFVLVAVIIYIILGRFTIGLGSGILAILLAVDGWQKGSGAKGFINAE